MRLGTFLPPGGAAPRLGLALEGLLIDLAAASRSLGLDPPVPDGMIPFLEAGERAWEGAREVERAAASGRFHESEGCAWPLARVRLLPPVPTPRKILCVGLNYRDHAAEVAKEVPRHPLIFTRFASTLLADGEPIRIPRVSEKVDYEGELAVVIGRAGRHIPEDRAYEHVAGYTCFNDVSVRDFQGHTSQYTMGKNFDASGPCGPFLVSRDEVPDPHALAISLAVDGEVLQSSNTGEMIFRIPRLIAYLSQALTLEPGDLIATGTPPGVGVARRPPRWLRPGERVQVRIERLGELTNPIEREG